MARQMSSTNTISRGNLNSSVASPATGGVDADFNTINNAIVGLTGNLHELSRRIIVLEGQQKPESEYFEKSKTVMNIALFTILLLPILTVISSIIIIYTLKPDESFLNIIIWLIGFLGVGTLVEFVYIIVKVKTFDTRIKKLEGK